MKLNTYLKETASFWKSRGFTPKKRYALHGFTNWQIEIPDDHPDLKHPDYVGLQAEEVLYVLPTVVLQRLAPPVFTLKVDKMFADVVDRNGKKGVPISHSRSVLTQMCFRPGPVDPPRIIKLNRDERVREVILKAQRQGTENILFFPLAGLCETIPIESALRVLKQF